LLQFSAVCLLVPPEMSNQIVNFEICIPNILHGG
jgi:hypothetical protein